MSHDRERLDHEQSQDHLPVDKRTALYPRLMWTPDNQEITVHTAEDQDLRTAEGCRLTCEREPVVTDLYAPLSDPFDGEGGPVGGTGDVDDPAPQTRRRTAKG